MANPNSNQVKNKSIVSGSTLTDALNTLSVGSGGGGVTDHGLLTGLGDDDHPQYQNQARGDARYSQLNHNHPDVTISDPGFMSAADKLKLNGISSGATLNDTDVNLKNRANHTGVQPISSVTDLQTTLDGKQSTLVSATNIKTINGFPLLGSGDLSISGSGVTDHSLLTGLSDDDHPQYHNNARGDARYAPISHTHVIADVTGLQTALDDKQDALVSATNIKTVNGASILGSGNLVVTGDGDHGVLTGLGDDDHPQYLTNARGDARYSSLSHVHAATVISNTPSGNIAATTVQAAINELDSGKVGKTGDTMTGNLVIDKDLWADVTVRAYGSGGDGPTLHGGFARGTKVLPSTPLAGDAIFGIGARPYEGSGSWAGHSTAAIHFFARENVSTTTQGTSLRLAVTPLGGSWADRMWPLKLECDGVGQGGRWRAKFSGSSQAGRTFVQDDTGNSTAFGVLAGAASGKSAAVNCFAKSDPDASSYLQVSSGDDGFGRIYSGATGAAAASPLLIGAGVSPTALRISTAGAVTFDVSMGYSAGVGTGGSVTQLTSKSTSVTLNKASGRITMHNAALASDGVASFLCSNSIVGANDTVSASINADSLSAFDYLISAHVVAGAIRFVLHNKTGASRSDAVAINFNVIKGAAA